MSTAKIIIGSIHCILILVGIWSWPKQPTPIRYLIIYILLSFVTLMISHLAALYTNSNMLVLRIHGLLTLPIVYAIYYSLFKSTNRRKVLSYLSFLTFLVVSIELIFSYKSNQLPILPMMSTGLAFTTISLLYFREILIHAELPAWRNSYLLINTAMFAYFSTVPTVWTLYNYSLRNDLSTDLTNNANTIINICVNLMFGFAMILDISNSKKMEYGQ